MGECNKETTFAMLDFFYENGGNFIDTYVELGLHAARVAAGSFLLTLNLARTTTKARRVKHGLVTG